MRMSDHTPRSFEVPTALVAAGFTPTADLDALDREVEFSGEYGEWAEKVLFVENAKTLQDVCGEMRLLPRGVLSSVQLDDGSLLVAGLVDSDGRVRSSQTGGWATPADEINVVDETTVLDDDEVAFVARALREGADEVWFRPYIPKAFVSAVVAAPAAPASGNGKTPEPKEPPPTAQEVPAGSAIIAVVDPIDEDAVLEMLAITPGPRILRRHDGQWLEDPEWVPVLKSVKPPKIVKLSEAQVASVSSQVDRSTADQDWEPFEADSREQYQIFTASAGRSPYLQELQRESDETALFALVAAAGRKLTPKDAASTERLKRYWTVGKGAAKIRWGTPGSWSRCHRHMIKYVGPKVAPGLCTNLSKRLGGPGIATHVTSSADTITAANPTGVNGYDKGKTFEQSTGGVERDYSGRFSSEGGSNRSERAKRRKASMARRKRERDEKDAKRSDSAANKAEREELARLSLEIAKLRSEGKTIEAAELRVRRAELVLEYADTPTERMNAQAALINAQDALRRARIALLRKQQRGTKAHAMDQRAWDGSTPEQRAKQREREAIVEDRQEQRDEQVQGA